MATDRINACGGADRITGLSDDVLHSILARLPSTAEAARTSVLSRRWRRVWSLDPRPGPRLPPQLRPWPAGPRQHRRRAVGPRRGDPSPRSASPASSGLRLVLHTARGNEYWKEFVIPFCERVTAISFCLNHKLRFPLNSAGGGAFTALASLEITHGCIDGGELELVLCSRCPRLKKLALEQITLRLGSPGPQGLCIRSNSLEQLKIAHMKFPEGIQVATPELQSLSIDVSCDLRIVAPKLSELYWYAICDG
ncbi:unnamed protein product [Urochloa decumbens]|uniref:F-box domain-containing protein n=1 Tax=Urochloa decumbens TaxID=240449 RepID=A0ABC9G4N1_9POAL